MQYFKFPMEYLRVTQGENSIYSHRGSLAMDFGGKDGGADKLYCPCKMIVKRHRTGANGELYMESTDKVMFADGTVDYARLLCLHDNSFNVKTGQIIKQGEYFYDEGGMGSGQPGKFANHVHIEAGKGRWKSTTQAKNNKGTYVIENQAHLYDLFVLGDDVVIMDDGGYKWKRQRNTENDTLNAHDIQALLRAEKQKNSLLEKQLSEEKEENEDLYNDNDYLYSKLLEIQKIVQDI